MSISSIAVTWGIVNLDISICLEIVFLILLRETRSISWSSSGLYTGAAGLVITFSFCLETDCWAAALISVFITRPLGPVPLIVVISTDKSLASFRATGVANTFVLLFSLGDVTFCPSVLGGISSDEAITSPTTPAVSSSTASGFSSSWGGS